MGMQGWAQEMARYNRWQNEVLFSLSDTLTEKARTADRGLFFGSIHRTLDHILMVDSRLIDLVASGLPPSSPFEPDRMVYDDYSVLSDARRQMDRRLLTLADSHDDSWFDDTLVFTSPLTGRPRELPRHFYLVQLFNHATHHRSQITAEMHRQGMAYGATDLPMNPQSLY